MGKAQRKPVNLNRGRHSGNAGFCGPSARILQLSSVMWKDNQWGFVQIEEGSPSKKEDENDLLSSW